MKIGTTLRRGPTTIQIIDTRRNMDKDIWESQVKYPEHPEIDIGSWYPDCVLERCWKVVT